MLAAFLLAACGSATSAVQTVDPQNFLASASQTGAVVVDVRTPEEFAAGHLRDRGLAHVMHHPGEPRRAEGEGQGGSLTEHLHRAVDLGDITQHPRRELHPRIGLDRSSKRELGAGGTIGVVEHRSRHAAHCESANVSDARAPLEPGLPAGERAIPASDEGQDLARSRQSSIDHGDSSCHAVRCIRCLSADALSEADPLVS